MSWDKENASPQGSPQTNMNNFQNDTFKTLMKEPTTFTMDTSDDYHLSSSDEFGMHSEDNGGEFMPVTQPSCASTGGMDQTEDLTGDLFSEWRFDLASHLSGEPKLLQRIVRLIERLEQENENLKEENSDKKARIKDLMHEATCMYERLTSGKEIDGEEAASHKRKFSTRSSPGKSKKSRISSSSEGEPENEEKLNKAMVNENTSQEIKTTRSRGKVVGSFFLGALFSVCSFLILFVAVAAELKIFNSSEQSFNLSFSDFSFLESATTSTTTTTTVNEDTLQFRLQHSERQHSQLTVRFKEAEAAAIHNQAAAGAIQQRYNELSQDHGRMNHDLQILRMFVSRRGPVVDEPGKHCWAEWFTPEICCSPWYGPQGHPGCWSGAINYHSCCGFFSTKDTTSRYAYYTEKALPER